MSNRTPGVPPAGIPAYRQDDDRRRDEARLSTLQTQVDEVRQALRELASRQVRLEDHLKQTDGQAAQNRIQLEQVRQENQQSAQARAIDENRTRQQLADLEQNLDENLQALGDRNAVVTHQLRDSIDAIRSEMEQVRRDIIRNEDAVKVVD